VLLHGDIWPLNVLWRDGAIAAVVDWEDACVGDPLYDVAVARLDLLWAYGDGAMRAFTTAYARAANADMSDLGAWDLVAALRPAGEVSAWAGPWPEAGRPDITPATMRAAHGRFVASAARRIARV
jgi:Ser/Thr protein kinase RdoA (MazF antagonist)